MAITKFVPEVWSATLLSILEKSLVYAGAPCVNRNYEGEIAAFGDTVHITSIADPSIVDYTKDTDLTVEVLTDAEQQLLIDQQKAFAFEIDDIDMRQSRAGGALMTEAAQRAAFGLADKADQYIAAKMAGAAGNSLGVIDATTATNVYDKLIVGSRTKLAQANVPSAGRWLVVDPATTGQLLLDSRFIKANESGTSDALRNGHVGRAGGFDIFESNNAIQSNRQVTAITTASGAKTLTGVAGQFNQGDVGLSVTGTGVGASAKVVSVNADGSVATVDVNSSASAAVTVTLAGGGQLAIAGSSIATSYAEQISKVEAFRPEKRFADALKGLHLYGAKVVRPTALVVASVKVS
jgi:hypothetical protein